MTGLEFFSKIIPALVWPLAITVLLFAYRRRIEIVTSMIMGGRKVKRIKAGPVELEWEPTAEGAADDIALALADTADPPGDFGPIPTNLVDLFPLAAANPRRAIRNAYQQVRRALNNKYPQLRKVSEPLAGVLEVMANKGQISDEVASVAIRLKRLLELSESKAQLADSVYAYQFLQLAEGAIHAILRDPHSNEKR